MARVQAFQRRFVLRLLDGWLDWVGGLGVPRIGSTRHPARHRESVRDALGGLRDSFLLVRPEGDALSLTLIGRAPVTDDGRHTMASPPPTARRRVLP
jgi:hypothetical protein